MANSILATLAIMFSILGFSSYVYMNIKNYQVEMEDKENKIYTLSKERDDINASLVEGEAKREFEVVEKQIKKESDETLEYTRKAIEDETINTFSDTF